MEAALFDGDAQGFAVSQQMALPGKFIQIAGTHAVGQRLTAYILGIEKIVIQDRFNPLPHRRREAG